MLNKCHFEEHTTWAADLVLARRRFAAPCQLERCSRRHSELQNYEAISELSAISPGTELLVYNGNVPTELAADSNLDALSGSLSYPLKYGYAAVGVVEAIGDAVDADWLGRRVFAFNPHESHFCATVDELYPIPEGISAAQATLLPTVETAVTLVQDGPGVPYAAGDHQYANARWFVDRGCAAVYRQDEWRSGALDLLRDFCAALPNYRAALDEVQIQTGPEPLVADIRTCLESDAGGSR